MYRLNYECASVPLTAGRALAGIPLAGLVSLLLATWVNESGNLAKSGPTVCLFGARPAVCGTVARAQEKPCAPTGYLRATG